MLSEIPGERVDPNYEQALKHRVAQLLGLEHTRYRQITTTNG
jgi:hypothetical protein